MSQLWHLLVIVVSLVSLIAYIIFVVMQSKTESTVNADESTGHTWDGITELNKPLPKWWFYTFIGLCIWGVGFAFYYPALGNLKGFANWSQENQYDAEVRADEAAHAGYYQDILSAGSIEAISEDSRALDTGRRLFLNNCAVCHASDAAGGTGYPNLTDNDWLYGGDGDTILATITKGRNGNMPPQEEIVKMVAETANISDPVNATAEYVLTLSGLAQPSELSEQGKTIYQQVCIACHGPEGKGMHALGAPNLTDNVWLYVDLADSQNPDAVKADIVHSILNGNQGEMPAHEGLISEEKLKVLAAYVYSLSDHSAE